MKTLLFLLLNTVLIIGCNQTKNIKTNPKNNQTIQQYDSIPFLTEVIVFNFDNYQTGKIPNGWSQSYIGKGNTNWQIVDDGANKVLAQLASDNPNYHFNQIVFDGFKVKNVSLTVKLKGVAGKKDQGGGFIWRFIDPDNYYVVRANPLEDNVVLYKVENGKRTDLPLMGQGRTYGVDVEPLGNDWNNLKITVIDNLFTVYLNGKKLFTVKDETFSNEGKIGLWTKADAVTYFDDLQVNSLDK